MGQLDKIDHIVVLMLESRSFDSMLGKLYPQSSKFEDYRGRNRTSTETGPPSAYGTARGPTKER
jgi:phospholipase C